MDELQPSVAPGEVRLVGGEQKSRNADRVLQIDWCETIWGVSRATGVTGVDAIEIVPLQNSWSRRTPLEASPSGR
jgi:hypothetical protein